MADVVPDRNIDIFDLSVVSINFGKNGTYMTGLTGVWVLFNTGKGKLPDSDGFVVIPLGVNSFIVIRNGTPIGAMVIFW